MAPSAKIQNQFIVQQSRKYRAALQLSVSILKNSTLSVFDSRSFNVRIDASTLDLPGK
jgi:uncharacterized Rmd1/YagE family protein